MLVQRAGLWLTAIGLALFLPVSEPVTSVIRIAWLAPSKLYYYFNASTSLGALAHALDTITSDPSLLPGYTFEVRHEDSDCNSKSALGAIFNVLSSSYQPHLIVGPACSPAMDPVAQLGSIHNLPVFGWISSDGSLANKEKYNTLVRLLGPLTSTGEGMLILLKHYTWHKVILISTTGPDYGELGKGIRNAIKRNAAQGFQITRWVQDVQENISVSGVRDIYHNVKQEARIILLCVPLAELRRWMLAAYDENMVGGDYVFIYTNQIIPSAADMATFGSTSFYSSSDGRDQHARQAYSNLIMFYQKTLDFDLTNGFLSQFNSAAHGGNWSAMTGVFPAPPDLYSLFLYDALLLYAKVATQAGTIDNGTAIFEACRGALITGGATGTILMSDTADRYPDYWIMDMNTSGVFDTAGATDSSINGTMVQRSVKMQRPIIWGDGTSGWANRPLDVPQCGFRNERCENRLIGYLVPPAVVVVLAVCFVVIFIVYRNWAREKELNNMYWKINYEDLKIFRGKRGFGSQSFVSLSKTRLESTSLAESLRGQLFVKVANYRGHLVAVKDVRKTKVKVDRTLLEEFRMMSQIKHNNLLTFIGASIDEPNICAVWEYCSKGSLQDVIWNENITLDEMFKFSISLDVAKGLHYLHGSGLKCHGRLKSNNVVIDGRWVCKLADYGLRSLLADQEGNPDTSEHVAASRLMWTAPEVLKTLPLADTYTVSEPDIIGTQPGDIYGLGVLLKEIFCRNGPYTEYELFTPQEIINKVKNRSGEPFRPDLQLSTGPASLHDLIRSCWEEDPKDRPPIQTVLKKLTAINPFKKANVMDNMISMMEKYSNHLEEIVADRTMALEEEKKKTENLLYRMLPKSVAEDLKMGRPIAAESFDSVTIYFSDIVRFTDLAGESTPLQVVNLLNDLYTLFDSVIANHDVYKVETIGDAYMLVSGLPVHNGDRHVTEIVNCSLDLLSGVLNFRVPHKPEYTLHIRIGIHTGPCVAGVVGLTMPRYCLFGDTVNTASRMESNGLAYRIHLSPTTSKALSCFSGYKMAARGGLQVKGKGFMETSWLIGHEEFDKPLPDFYKLSQNDDPAPKPLPPTVGKPWKILKKPRSELLPSLTTQDLRDGKLANGTAQLGVRDLDGGDDVFITEEESNLKENEENEEEEEEEEEEEAVRTMCVVGQKEEANGRVVTSKLPPISISDTGIQREGTITNAKLPPIGSSEQTLE